MNINENWLQKIKTKVVGMTAASETSKEKNLQSPEKEIDKTAEIIELIKTADETLEPLAEINFLKLICGTIDEKLQLC